MGVLLERLDLIGMVLHKNLDDIGASLEGVRDGIFVLFREFLTILVDDGAFVGSAFSFFKVGGRAPALLFAFSFFFYLGNMLSLVLLLPLHQLISSECVI